MAGSNLAARHVHVIPVDPSLTVEEAWRELCIFGQRITYTAGQDCGWTHVTCDGDECHLLGQT